MSEEHKKPAVVVHVLNEFSVAINKGSEQGVKKGDTYLVYALGPELTDPETGESLGQLEIVRGRASVRHVQEKVSTLEAIEFEETPGRRRIIKRDGGSSGILSLSLGLAQREEIEENPERTRLALGAALGDLARILKSN